MADRRALRRESDVASAVDPQFWYLRDEGGYGIHWMVRGDWTRGQAVVHVAQCEGCDFTELRARRCYARWAHHDFRQAGWRFEDGTLVSCERRDEDAMPFWSITEKTRGT